MYLDKVEITKQEDIITTKYFQDAEVTLKDATSIDNCQLTLASGQDMFILVDFTEGGISIDNKAEDFFLHHGLMLPFTKAVAIVGEEKSKGLFHRIFGRSKTWYDFKKCNSTEEAKSWFESISLREKGVA